MSGDAAKRCQVAEREAQPCSGRPGGADRRVPSTNDVRPAPKDRRRHTRTCNFFAKRWARP